MTGARQDRVDAGLAERRPRRAVARARTRADAQPREARVGPDHPGELEPVGAGHRGREQRRRRTGRRRGRARVELRRGRRRPRPRDVDRHRQAASCSSSGRRLRRVVVDDQHPEAAEHAPRPCDAERPTLRADGALEGGGEPERAAAAPARSRRRSRRRAPRRAGGRWPARARCRRTAGRGRVGLGERLEEPVDRDLGRDADAGVGDLDPQHGPGRPSAGRASARTTTSPRSVNFTALEPRLVDDLAEADRVAASTMHGTSGRGTTTTSSSPLARAALAEHAATLRRGRRAASKSTASSSSLPASIFDKSRMSLMSPSSASAGAWRCRRRAAAGAASSSVRSSSSVEADDAVERGADLVAHRGEELRLRARGLHRRVARRRPGARRSARGRPPGAKRAAIWRDHGRVGLGGRRRAAHVEDQDAGDASLVDDRHGDHGRARPARAPTDDRPGRCRAGRDVHRRRRPGSALDSVPAAARIGAPRAPSASTKVATTGRHVVCSVTSSRTAGSASSRVGGLVGGRRHRRDEAEGLLGVLLLGDVLGRAAHPTAPALGVARDEAAAADPADARRRAHDPGVELEGSSDSSAAPTTAAHAGAVVRVDAREEALVRRGRGRSGPARRSGRARRTTSRGRRRRPTPSCRSWRSTGPRRAGRAACAGRCAR